MTIEEKYWALQLLTLFIHINLCLIELYSTTMLFMEANSVGFLEFCSTRQQ